MNISPEQKREIDRMPAALRALVEAELKVGNEIVEIGHSFPAAPVGCYVMLARPVSSGPRASSEGIDFYDRNALNYSGEYADRHRHFFVLEPPRPQPPEPDMDAIRDANAKSPPPKPLDDSAVGRFIESMHIDYEKWHDGIGYDIDIIRNATSEELVEIEQFLIGRPVDNWRDVEALAALDTPRARVALKKALRQGNHAVRGAVVDHAPHLVSASERTASLVSALQHADIYGGLSEALDQTETFHPPEVIEALFRGLLERSGEVATHFSAMLMFLHGKAPEAFDWNQRPFFLKFQTDDGAERRKLFRELCAKIEVDADTLLKQLGV